MPTHQLRLATIPLLTALLKDQQWEVRWVAAEALGKVGPEAKAAIPALTELLKYGHEQVRQAASDSLERIKKGK